MRLLLTGSNGLVGQKILTALRGRSGWDILATSRGPNLFPPANFYRFQNLDITDAAQVQQVFESFKPEAVIHTAAMTQVDPAEKQRDLCWKINAEGTRQLAAQAKLFQSHFVHLSTDFIFSGEAGPYRENDAPGPVNYYGESKLAAENEVQSLCSSWTIVRTVLVYGVLPHLVRPNILTFVKGHLEQKKKIRVVNDQFRTPTLAEDLAEACLAFAEHRKNGIFHISGEELVSIYDFARKIAAVFELDASLIEPVDSRTLAEPARRPARTGFIIEKARTETGYRPHSLESGLLLIKKQFEGMN